MPEYHDVRVKAAPCANGETVEWSLMVGQQVAAVAFLTNVSPADAFAVLAQKAATRNGKGASE